MAVLFPGQGSASAGMRDAVERAWPELLEVVTEAVGEDPFARVGEGTRFDQPAILCASLARWAAAAPRADFVAGHSLGELGALVAAGSIAPADAVRLVAIRGELMERAGAASGGGTMLALGCDAEAAGELAAACGLAVANENSPTQTVLSGPEEAVEEASGLAAARGVRAKRLPVSGAFHSPAMAAAVPPFRDALAEIEVRPPRVTVISGVTANPFDDIRGRLAEALVRPVRWRAVVATLGRAGVRHFVETGPGRVLSGLVRRTLEGAHCEQLPDPPPDRLQDAEPDLEQALAPDA